MLWFYISINNQEKIDKNEQTIRAVSINYKIPVNIRWYIKEFSYIKDWKLEYLLHTEEIWWIPTKDINMAIKAEKWSFVIWEIIELNSKINEIKSGTWFDYKKLMLSKDIYWNISNYYHKDIWIKDWYIWKILKFRITLVDIIEKIYPWNSSRLVKWILLGIKWDYPDDIKQWLSSSWLTHIVAVSWYNITVIIIFISYLIKPFPKIIQSIVTVLLILIFIILVWNNAPAIRAWIMGCISVLLINWWKDSNIYTLTLLSAIIMVFPNPLILSVDLSFQLSYLAMIWLISIWKVIWEKLSFLPEKFWIKENITATISVTIVWLPIMASNFWSVSIISPISNLIVLPLVPFAMLISWLSIIIYPISNIAWIIIWYPAYILCTIIIKMSSIFWNLSFAAIKTDIFSKIEYLWIIYFLVLLVYILSLFYKQNRQVILPLK